MPRRPKKTTSGVETPPPPAPDPPVCPSPSDEACAYGTWFALHDAGMTTGLPRRKTAAPAEELTPSAS